MSDSFVHLHVHTEYSMLDGAARLKDMFKHASSLGMPAVAMTDHGNMHGAADFTKQATAAGHQADPRHRGVRRAGIALQPEADPLGPAAPEVRRRLRRRPLRARHHLGPERHRSAEPHQALLPRLHRGLRPQVPAHGRRAHGGALRRPDGHHRLPLGLRADPAAPGPLRRGARRRRAVPGDLRQGELLPGADGPRSGHRDPGPRGAAGHRARAEHPAGGHQRLALHLPRRVRRARRAAVHPDRLEHRRPGPLPVRRRRLLPEDRRRDAGDRHRRHLAGGLPEHAADRGEGEPGGDVLLPEPDAAAGGAGRADRGPVVPQARLRRPEQALPGRRPGREDLPRAPGVRARRHLVDGLPLLLHRGRGLHQLGQGQRHRRRPGPRFGRGVAGRLVAGHHRRRPDPVRPAVRAVPEPRPRHPARHRHRLRRPPPLGRDPLRHREVRRGQGRDDRHLRPDQGQGGDQGLQPDPGLPVRDGRPHHQGDAAGRDGQVDAAVRGVRQQPPALRRGRRDPRDVRAGRGRQEGHRHRPRRRGPDPPARRARGRRHHLPGDDHRPRAGHDAPRRRRHHHAVRLSDLRGNRPDQDGLPGSQEPDDHHRRAEQRRDHHRRASSTRWSSRSTTR